MKRLTADDRVALVAKVRAMLCERREEREAMEALEAIIGDNTAMVKLLERIQADGNSSHVGNWKNDIAALGIGQKAPTLEEFDQALPRKMKCLLGSEGKHYRSFISDDGAKLARVAKDGDTLAVAVVDTVPARMRRSGYNDGSYSLSDAPSAVEFVAKFLEVE